MGENKFDLFKINVIAAVIICIRRVLNTNATLITYCIDSTAVNSVFKYGVRFEEYSIISALIVSGEAEVV